MKRRIFIRVHIPVFLAASLLLVLSACDKVDPPYKETVEQPKDTTPHVRRILLEEYTGHTCGNCPTAADMDEQVKNVYGDRVVHMAVHAGFFALPKNNPDSSYAIDYRTPAGNEWNTFFGNDNAGLPNGMINRRAYNGSRIITPGNWLSAAATLLAEQPAGDLVISNSYDINMRRLNTTVSFDFVSDDPRTLFPASIQLVVCVVEDSIVDWQKDYRLPSPSDIPKYVHRNVLRETLSSTWGDTVTVNLATTQYAFSKSYMIVLNPAWDAKHCKVIAIAYYSNYEVIQAAEKRIF